MRNGLQTPSCRADDFDKNNKKRHLISKMSSWKNIN